MIIYRPAICNLLIEDRIQELRRAAQPVSRRRTALAGARKVRHLSAVLFSSVRRAFWTVPVLGPPR